jgi:hypothetical protein
MNHLIRPILHIVVVTLIISFAAMSTKAQDPVTVDSSYKVLYEDSDVRVLRYDDKPGHVVPKHTHQYPYRVYVITDATREFFGLDAKTQKCQKPTVPVPVKLFANDELMRPPTTHCEFNSGTTETHLIIFEFKNQKPTTTAALRRRPNNSLNRSGNSAAFIRKIEGLVKFFPPG